MEAAQGPVEVLGDQLELLTRRSQEFERQQAQALRVDAAGLATMEHLIRSGPTTPTELARRLEVSTAAMTLVVDRLETAGHVVRRPHPSDRRKVLVSPEPGSVQSAQDQVQPLINGVEALAASLDPRELEVVSRFLSELLRVYDDALSGPVRDPAPEH